MAVVTVDITSITFVEIETYIVVDFDDNSVNNVVASVLNTPEDTYSVAAIVNYSRGQYTIPQEGDSIPSVIGDPSTGEVWGDPSTGEVWGF